MADEPESLGELGRLIRSLSQQVSSQFGEMNKRLDSFVPAQVHAASERRMDEQLARFSKDLGDVKREIEKDITDLSATVSANRTASKSEIKDMSKDLTASIKELKDSQRWVITAVLIPGILAVIAIVGLVITLVRGG
jgi:uncharacterized protein YaaW (UPF0174 family)